MKKTLILAAAIVASLGASAKHLTPEEALARLNGPDAPKHAPALKTAQPTLVYSAKAADVDRLYVFADKADDNFVVLSADDNIDPVIAYADGAEIDFNNLPDNIRYWFDEYARQIEYAAAHPEAAAKADIVQRPTVEPKITTLWDQLEPFNEFTPTYYGLPTPTGCVATAMAQIMNWHRWPQKPVGKKTFTSYWVGQLYIDYDQITFEWDKMLDRYYRTSPDENIYAVATLMQACGYAAEMEYHNQSSGAAGYRAAIGMFTHFGYSKAMTLESRDWYQIKEWDDLVYAELTENGPVYYQGTGTGGGHAFVCDGYDGATGLFHFNWGWTGKGNGYYRLSLLNPDYQGTGGNSLGYNFTQDIIRGLRKAAPDDEAPLMVAPIMGVVTPWEGQDLGKQFSLKGYDTNDGFKNCSLVKISEFTLGARFHNVATGEDIYMPSNNTPYDMEPYYKVQVMSVNLPDKLAEGEYTVWPVWRSGESGKWNELRYSPLTRNYVPMTVEGNHATFGVGIAEGQADVKLTEAPDFFTTNGEFTLKGSITASGTKDFAGLVCAVFVTLDKNGNLQVVDQGESEFTVVEAGKTLPLDYTSRPQNGKLVDGDQFGIVIGNANTGELLSPVYAIKVGNKYGVLEMTPYDFKIASSQFLDPESVKVSTMLKVVSGQYDGPLAIGYDTKRDPFNPEKFTVSESMHLEAGDDRLVTFEGTLEGVEAGDFFYAHLMRKDADDQWIPVSQYPIQILVAKSFAGIEDLEQDLSAPVEYYNLQGIRVTNPTPGNLYLRRQGTKTTKTVF